MDLGKTLHISAAGLKVQGTRLRTIAENIANAASTAQTPGGDPYRRKVVTFENVLSRELDVELVRVRKVDVDRTDFGLEHRPGHPAADANGYVRTPNVNALIEMADMREAQRTYEANLRVIQASRTMVQQTIELLR